MTEDDLEFEAAEMFNFERNSPKVETKTVLRHIAGVRRYLQALGIAAPLAKYSPPEAAEGKPHPIEGGEDTIDRMLQAADGNEQKGALVALTGYMGFRVGEARAIRADKVDLVNRELLVRGKGDAWDRVPIPTKALVPLFLAAEDARKNGRETLIDSADRTVRQWFTDLAEEALGRKLDKSGREASHSARHSVGTDVYRDSKDLVLTQRILRHKDPKTTTVYIHKGADEIRKALNGRGNQNRTDGTN